MPKQQGFTLIEILITLSLSSILLLTGVAKYIDFNHTQTLKATGQNIKNNLRDIQGKALSGVKPTTNCVSTLDGYRVQIISSISYQADAVCGGLASNNPVTYQLPTGIIFQSPFPPQFQFNVLGQGVSTPTTLVVKDSQTNKCFSLTISSGGEITETGMIACAASPSPTPTPQPSSSPLPSPSSSPQPSPSASPGASPSVSPSPSPSAAPSPSPSSSPGLNLCAMAGGYCSSNIPDGCDGFHISPCSDPKKCIICL